ncbi:hypothetical protein M8044_000482 [Columbia Basin potato purple top phytoplasma]|uniref:Uncharacterized protein n=1 Tax=Columbia Basin potato purple top phytoplasma TaxID=307134 RepID=A0ABT5L9I5_9MOLU|nr:hypothetical protein [Columbia Basin potato purple top phytoplasma]
MAIIGRNESRVMMKKMKLLGKDEKIFLINIIFGFLSKFI